MTLPSLTLRHLGLALVAAASLACSTRRPASRPGDAVDDAGARAAIAAVSREFSARYERGDAAGMVALYPPHGVILPPGTAAMRGPEALARYWTLGPGARVLEHRVTADSVVVAGPVAYDWGTYRVRTQDAAGAVREGGGKYVIVWRETAPGTWRIHVDMWNAGPPAPRPASSP